MDDTRVAVGMHTALIEQLGALRYGLWFEGQTRFSLPTAGLLRVVVAAPFIKDWLQKNFLSDLETAASRVLGGGAKIEITIEDSAEAPMAEQPPSPPSQDSHARGAAKDSPSSAAADPKRCAQDPWAELVCGASNRSAIAAAKRLINGAGPSLALVWGGSGAGKTCLLKAARDAACLGSRKTRAIYLPALQFVSDFVEACKGAGLPSFRRKLQQADLLVVDDVQHLVGKAKTTEEFQQVVDWLGARGRRVLLSSDRPLAELRGLGPELVSRLSAATCAEVSHTDAAMRRDLALRWARERGREMDDRVAQTLAHGLMGGARELAGALNRLELECEAHPQLDPVELAQRVVEIVNGQSQPAVRLEDIHRAVSAVFGVEPSTLLSTRRTKSVTEPRMLAMWLARKYTRAAWSEIGAYFGQRSHSTVISAHRRVEDLMQRRAAVRTASGDCDLSEALRRVEARLRAG